MSIVEQCVPPLEAGDSLSRDEFMRRWELHPEIKHAELIGGVVYMPSPLSLAHGETDNDVSVWLGTYKVATPGTASANNATTLLADDSLQPDVNLRILTECGGSSRPLGKYLGGVPELFVEVCVSSASYDLHRKFDLYEDAKVPEYVAVLLYEREIRWHVLQKVKYVLMPPAPDGIWRSRVFPGLWLDGAALLQGDLATVLKRLGEGLGSPEHAAFVQRLAAHRSRS